MALYIFDNDTTPGASACNAGCVAAWPPLLTTSDTPPSGVTGASGTFTVITREDGTKQIAYNGKPVYHFVNDAVAGDTKGDGVGGIWHIATP
jgi:predicted lipoprotein with Yx(FWY)xxD motif